MNIHDREHRQSGEYVPGTAALVVPLRTLDRTLLPLVGGKAANLGELTRAGFSVPDGFCVTTAAYVLLSDGAGLEPILAELASTRVQETVRLTELAAAARAALLQAPVPASCVKAITEAYQELSDGAPLPVAVRSSATTEDLPEASFAGQQETFLNIVGVEAVLAAVQRCWVSLWTDRAVSYRASLGIDPRTVRLAVVVQRMVEAQVAGVLFTANPLTGKRHEIVIDANPGLGEAVVSGMTNPDHFVVETSSGEIVERRLGDKQVVIVATPGGGTRQIEVDTRAAEPCLSDAQARALAAVGAELAEAGRLSQAEDIFFITLPEAREALTGTDMRSLVRERRTSYEQELARRHVPLVLLSDGTEPMTQAEVAGSGEGTLQGTPASPGIVMATARVILNPHGARLEHGEILVAPSTDPGWTPLFLTAGGLVMETGGAMAHGAIVAREYGIPAVVGVPKATERITTGSRITVNGTTGKITIEPTE